MKTALLVLAWTVMAPFPVCDAASKPFAQTGVASWYGNNFRGHKMANGRRYNPDELSAAHRTLPFGTRVRVTNLRNGRSVVVCITNRGPFVKGRILDLSTAAARQLDMMHSDIARVRIELAK